MKNLTQGKPSKIILQFALPLLLGNLFQLFYTLADTRIVGTFLGNDALAAVGATTTLSDLIVGFLMGLTNGFAVVTARYFGMGDSRGVRRTFHLSIGMGLVIASALTVFSLACLNPILGWLNVSSAQWDDSRRYIGVIFAGMIFSCLYNIFASSLRAVGDSFTPLLFLILSAGLNIVLDIYFVKYTSLHVAGAALATILAQAISAGLCFCYMWRKYPIFGWGKLQNVLIREQNEKENTKLQNDYDEYSPRGLMLVMLKSGVSMGLMSSLVNLGSVSLQTAINTFGENTIVAHAAARKLTNLFMMPYMVLGMTMATYCGQNYGAKKIDRMKEGLKVTLIYGAVWSVFLWIVIFTICPVLIRGVTGTKIQEVIDTGTLYLQVNCILYFVVAVIAALRNGLQGMGDHTTPVISSGIELIGKVIIAKTLAPVIGYYGVMISEPIVWVVMVIPLIVSMRKKLRTY